MLAFWERSYFLLLDLWGAATSIAGVVLIIAAFLGTSWIVDKAQGLGGRV
jgi:hypothetical protein